MGKITSYSVWHDKQEQRDPIDIDKPDLECRVESPFEAAQLLADDGDSDYGHFIVRDNVANTYWRIKLVRGWELRSINETSIEKLRSP
jgi:hypothetical protein